jgi:hypothetical protein
MGETLTSIRRPTSGAPHDRRAAANDLVTVATYRRQQVSGASSAPWPLHPFTRVDVILAIIIAAAALAIRWPLIERGQTLLHPDEAVVGIMAQDIAAGERFPVYFYGQRYMGVLEAYAIAAISPWMKNPIHALRLGPALFFALFVSAQYLMSMRWFGRGGGLAGAALLLAGSPMFAQWSIAPRGGYIEVLLWGSLILWAYMEWFAVHDSIREPQAFQRFLFGLLVGSGLWINPSILFFILPIIVHAALNHAESWHVSSGPIMKRWHAATSRLGITAMPVTLIIGVLALNCVWSVWVDDGRIRTMVLLELLPRPIAAVALVLAGAMVATVLIRTTKVAPAARQWLAANGVMILGAFAGALPCVAYVVQRMLRHQTLEPALPLGLRPLWQTGETLVYLLRGLPLWFGADPTPFVDHVTAGRERTVLPLDLFQSTVVSVADKIILAAFVTGIVLFLHRYRRPLSSLLSLKTGCYAPPMLLLMGAAGTILLYLLGGCTCSFTTIRYLLPLWAFLPGLVAAVWTGATYRVAARGAVICVLLGWGAGQTALHAMVGKPHPLSELAERISQSGPRRATAEILDAHLLSFLTNQRCRIREYDPFWPRLAHFNQAAASVPVDYLVNTGEIDRTCDWTDAGWPGSPPPETQRTLWPRLRHVMRLKPDRLIERYPLVGGYERIRLTRPIDERSVD